MQFSTILLLVGSFAVANAHFLLNYPKTRGFDEDKEPNFCGGFPVSNSRSQFPLSSGFVSITSEHPQADVNILISFDNDPTAFANFNKTAAGNNIPLLMNFTQMNAQGDACFPVNISALDVPEAKDGANATIQFEFNGPDGLLFQCADVVLSNSFTVPSGTKCDNATGAFPSSTAPSGSSSGSSPSATATSPNGATVLKAGATGLFGVLLGVVALVL